MLKQKKQSTADRNQPTSALPFAAARCDVPYLDVVKHYRLHTAKKLDSCADDAASFPAVCYAWSMVAVCDRLSQIEDLLASAGTLFEKARRGDATELSAEAGFDRATNLLGLSRELLEGAILDADDALDKVCRDVLDAHEKPT